MVKIEFKNMSPDPAAPCVGSLEEWKKNKIVYRVTVDLDEDVPTDKLQVQVVTNQDVCDDGMYGYKWKKFDMKPQEQDFIQGFLNKYTYELETCYMSTSWLAFSFTFRARIVKDDDKTKDRKKDWVYATTPAENGLVRINQEGANMDYIKRASAMLYHSANFLGVSGDSTYVLPDVKMDFMHEHLKAGPPELPTPFHILEKEITTVIEPGMMVQQSRSNHSFYPVQNSFESLAGEVLAMGYNSVAALWHSSPSSTELEVNMMDWLVEILHLPETFLHFKGTDSNGLRRVMPGGGVIQPSSSVAIMVAVLSARSKALGYREIKRDIGQHDIEGFYDAMAERAYPKLPKLVAYISDQCHNCFEKNFLLASVRIRKIRTHKKDAYRLNPATLKALIEEDEKKGLIPFFAVASVGTTGGAIIDSVEEVGKVCKEKNIWFHVDGAYAGNMFVCEEFTHLIKGLERADSMNITLHKWMPLCLDAAGLWLADKSYMVEPYKIHASYLHEFNMGAVKGEDGHYLMPDLSDLCIELTRKDRALKIWFVIKLLGVEGLRMHIREHIKLANCFARMVEADSEFELVNKIPEDQLGPNKTHLVQTGLCAFRLKNARNGLTANERNKKLVEKLVDGREFFLIPATLYDNDEEVWFVRMVVCANNTMISDIKDVWRKIQEVAGTIGSTDDSKSLSQKRH